jgi:threonine aldolase
MIKKPQPKRSFASDNNAGVHPKILQAMAQANRGHVVAYGDDQFTESAIRKFRELLGPEVEVYFVFSGTGANVLGLKAMTKAYHAIICAETAHINVDECGAPERFTGCKLLAVPSTDGKLRPENIKPLLHGIGVEHHVQPRVISISQSTEMGTVYRPDEIKRLADFAHQHNLLLHVDGARIANAAASLKVRLSKMTSEAGVDVLSFGGAKNGMMYGEAVVFFNSSLAADFKFIRKQGSHLASKMRFISAQFQALLTNNLWKKNAAHANRMAQILALELAKVRHVEITQKVEANGVFAILPKEHIPALQKQYFFYVWNETTSEVRLMTSFDTTEEDITKFVALVKRTVK